jgi:hypothetical protein
MPDRTFPTGNAIVESLACAMFCDSGKRVTVTYHVAGPVSVSLPLLPTGKVDAARVLGTQPQEVALG